MKASFNTQFDPQFDSQPDDVAVLAYSAQNGVGSGARACVVNRTHRVVRERATVIQARRSRARSLMVPLIICSALLILLVVAVWSGLYSEAAEAAEAVQADVAALATTDSLNHFIVVLLWFVPVTLAVLAAVWFRRARNSTDRETIR